jgi:phosphomannomutase
VAPLSLKIGPSGVRGVIGESLTPQLVTSFAAAFGTYCGAGPILIGTDTRPSGEMVKQAAIAGLLSVGCTPVDTGVVPLPSLMFHVREAGARGGIAVSGSHGSLEWNALRFIDAEGLALRANQAAELTDLYHQGVYRRVSADQFSDVRTDASSASRHLRAVTQIVDVERIRSRGFTVAVDPRGGAASGLVVSLLDALGCDVVAGRNGADAPRLPDPEPDEASLAAFGDLVRCAGADVGFVQDTDADRLSIVDEQGAWLGTDATVALVVRRGLERGVGPVVTNVATSRMVDDVAAGFGCPVYHARVGEAHVVEAMKLRGAEVGGEGDGGAIVLRVNPCRDSFVALAFVLEAMAVSGLTVSELRAQVPRYAMVREQLLCSARDVVPALRFLRSLFREDQLDLTDGVKVTWPDRWLLVRPSATEPVLRVAAEAPDEAEARSLVDRVVQVLSPGA